MRPVSRMALLTARPESGVIPFRYALFRGVDDAPDTGDDDR